MITSLTLMSGPFSGRWFRGRKAAGELVDCARPDRWPTGDVSQLVRALGWCLPVEPHSGDIEAGSDAVYCERDGVARLWMREDQRRVGRALLVDTMGRLASERHGLPLDRLRPAMRSHLEAEVSAQLRRAMSPARAIVPVLVCSGGGVGDGGVAVWVGRAGWHSDEAVLALLRGVVPGLVRMRAMPDGAGYAEVALACCLDVVRRGTGLLGDDVQLREVRVAGRGEHLLASDPAGRHREVLGQVLTGERPPAVTVMSVRVFRAGEWTELVFDEAGLVRAEPPRSTGGLLPARLGRRVADSLLALERWREVALEVVSRVRAHR